LVDEIMQKYVDENGTDGCTSFQIEIFEPEHCRGAYEATVEWEPVVSSRKIVV
jgi:hypothetical protein